MATMTKARSFGDTPKGIPDTKRCPDCKGWFRQDDETSKLLSSYDTHIRNEHPDLLARQDNFLRDLYKVPDEQSLADFFRDPIEEKRKEKRRMANATKEKPARAEKAPKAEPVPCMDGCGLMANPGRFFKPGHDARLKSQLIKISEGGPGEIADEVKPLLSETLFGGRFAFMVEKGWKKPPIQVTKTKASKADASKADASDDKADALAKLAQTSKANKAGAIARRNAQS